MSAPTDCWAFCNGILPAVSRSFALIIPQCPDPIDRGLCVAYLLCRIADTIEDEADLAVEARDRLYDLFLAAMDQPGDTARIGAFVRAWPAIPEGDYGRLVAGAKHAFDAFLTLPAEYHGPIRTCVRDMIAGMRTAYPIETAGGIRFFCRDFDDLDRYCHHVAGVVGIMSTALFELRLGRAGFAATPAWREEGRRLGLGLQMTNIIKDCRVDAERGVSFIPFSCLDRGKPGYELSPEGRSRLIEHTIGHLDAGLDYIRAIPGSETGLRVFLLGSHLPAIATLELAAAGSEYHPKIDRTQMQEILALIATQGTDNERVTTWYNDHRQRTLQAAGRD
ncbi:MAG TPA: squalene/phytoene synthase family protein [Phycisphaerae bacterium]|nr:squalene/phytoene synthase family protein [Phycisphaerae bacterium]HRY66578.1 squalene/phytoene synthase family protein [Phycisphaerae bacterium]HSA26998.1 squalene/phytoene synthase family protein [Phycisphaerae bacterium]